MLATLLAGPAQAQTNGKTHTVRAAIGEPLLQAHQLAQAGRYKDALAQIDAAATVPDPTPIERRMIGVERTYVLLAQKHRNDPANPLFPVP